MRHPYVLLLLLIALFGAQTSWATYSIVARDPETGEMGVAVQSHWFSVGSIVAWAEAGVGAVATQSLVDPSYGSNGLALMAGGTSPALALEQLLLADEHPEIRQVALINQRGEVATHTGAKCIDYASHIVGIGYSVQANLMEKSTVPQAMATAFEQTKGPLAERLIAALAAAQAEGGDIRGQQSAAILVVSAEATGDKWVDVLVDLRVEDHAEPVAEISRLLKIHRGYAMMNEGDLAVEAGDLKGADYFYGEAQRILQDNLEAEYWHAVALVNSGHLEAAMPLFGKIFYADENWRTLIPRLVKAGLLEASAESVGQIMSVIPAQK